MKQDPAITTKASHRINADITPRPPLVIIEKRRGRGRNKRGVGRKERIEKGKVRRGKEVERQKEGKQP